MIKMLRSLILSTLILSLAGCFAGRVEDQGAGGPELSGRGGTTYDWKEFYDKEKSDFRVQITNISAREPENAIENETAVTTHLEVVYQVQMFNRGNNQILRNQSFMTVDPLTDEQQRWKTDGNGKGSWAEIIEFDATQPQCDPVLMRKEIRGLSNGVNGSTMAVFEINPWQKLGKCRGDFYRDFTYQVESLQQLHGTYDPAFNIHAFLQDPSTVKEDHAEVYIKSAKFYLRRHESLDATVSEKMVNTYKMKVGASAVLKREEREDLGVERFYYRGNIAHSGRPEYVSLDAIRQSEFFEEYNSGQDPAGMRLKIDLNLALQRRYFINGKADHEDITNGKFMVFAALVADNQGTGTPLLLGMASSGFNGPGANGKKVSHIPTIANGNNLSTTLDMYTPHLVNRGHLSLAVKVVPMGRWAERRLKPFGIVYRIGDYNSFSGARSGFVLPQSDKNEFDYDHFVSQVKDMTEANKDWLIDKGYLRDAPEMIFSNMDIKFRTVKAGETATQRTVIFSVTTCPTDGFSGGAIGIGRKFKISVSGKDPLSGKMLKNVPINEIRRDGGDGAVAVQDNKCLSWVDEIAHKYYQRENLIERTYHIVPYDGHPGYDLKGYFNPWDEKYGTLGVDARTLSETFIKEIQERKKLPSRFFVGDYSYHTLRFRYNIDDDMGMRVKKTTLFSFYPFVKRYSNIINGINGNFPLRDGVYLLKIAYQKDYIDPGAKGVGLAPQDEDPNGVQIKVGDGTGEGQNIGSVLHFYDDQRRKSFIHTIKKLIRVENNRVITPVEFEIEDLRTLRIRANLLLEIEPVNQYKLQIVNLFQKLIAEKLTLKNGSLGRTHCLDPDERKRLLKAFQKVLDGVAQAIPDNINYSSKEVFKEVIESEAVKKALEPLTAHNQLGGISAVLQSSLTEEEIDKAFKSFSAGELADLSELGDVEAALDRNEVLRLALKARAAEDVAYQDRELFAPLDDVGGYTAEALSEDTEGLLDDLMTPMDIIGSGPVHSELEHILKPYDRKMRGAVQTLGQTGSHLTPSEKGQLDILKELTGDENLTTLMNNDFTVDPAVSLVSDLDYLIDREAGIIRRTFIGPLTLVNMDNKNSMNATDAMDYENCNGPQDCSGQNVSSTYSDSFSLQYEKSPYFGYQGQFKNCHVDDFIIREEDENILFQAWSECVSSHVGADGKETLEVKLPETFTCDYKKTEAYKKNPHVFQKYVRLDDEYDPTRLDGYDERGKPRLCEYRDRWLQKFFAQKIRKETDKQLSNFLGHQENRALLLVPPEGRTKETLSVGMISKDCQNKGFLSKDCIVDTDFFDLSTSELVDDIVEARAGRFQSPRKGWVSRLFGSEETNLKEGRFKEVLENFYVENKKILKRKKWRESDQEHMAHAIYKTLVAMAAPPHGLNESGEKDKGLPMAEPADFGSDVQKFFCNLLVPHALSSLEAYRKEAGLQKQLYFLVADRLEHDCFDYAKLKSSEVAAPFNIQSMYRTIKTGRYFFRGGKSINFNVGQGVRVDHTANWSNNFGLDMYNPAKDTAAGFLGAGGGGDDGDGGKGKGKGKATPLAAIGTAFKMVSLPKQGFSESNNKGDGLSLNSGTHLSMQAAQMDVELKAYRRCLLVRWNPRYLEKLAPESDEESEANGLLRDALSRLGNLFVCGDVETDDVAVRENYYYLTQHFTEGDLLDSGSLLNNPWLLSLRGYRDMVAFVTSLYPKTQYEASLGSLFADDWDRLFSDRPLFADPQLDPNSERRTFDTELQAWQMMAKTYMKVSPAFPGIFTQLNTKESTLPDWPWAESHQSEIDQVDKPTCQ